MVDLRKADRLFPALVLLLIFPSCVQMKSWLSPQASGQAPQTSAHAPQPSGQTPNQIKQHVTAGEYQKAIDLYKTEYKNHPQDRLLVKEYMKSLEEIKTTADSASGREDFLSAGKTYNVLQKNYPDFKDFARALTFDSAQLKSRLTNCMTALSTKGFQAYREGSLSEAISLWQDYLLIDPTNTDIKKAVKTAKTQQNNLQQIK